MRVWQPGGLWDRMTKRVLLSLLLGFAIVLILFVGMITPGVSRIAERLLGPGYAIPEAYWGAAHDPLQVLAAFLLNVIFYAALIGCVLWLVKPGSARPKGAR